MTNGWFLLVLGLIGLMGLAACEDAGELTEADYIERGTALRDDGDLRGALIEMRNALSANPKSSDARYHLAETHLKLGNGPAAYTLIRDLLDRNNIEERLVRPLGDSFLLMGQYEMVLDLFRPSRTDPPQRRLTNNVLRGKAFIGLDQISRAKYAFRAALKIDPNSVESLVGLGHVVLQEGDHEHAERFLARARQLAADDLDVMLLEGSIAFTRSDGARAESAYRDAVAKRPDLPAPKVGLAWALFANNKNDEAKEHLESVITDVPHYPSANHLLASIAYSEGNFGAAEEYAQNSLKSRVNHIPSLLIDAAAKTAGGKHWAARNAIDHVLKISPRNKTELKMLAQTQLRDGAINEAISTLRDRGRDLSGRPRTITSHKLGFIKEGRPAEGIVLPDGRGRVRPGRPDDRIATQDDADRHKCRGSGSWCQEHFLVRADNGEMSEVAHAGGDLSRS